MRFAVVALLHRYNQPVHQALCAEVTMTEGKRSSHSDSHLSPPAADLSEQTIISSEPPLPTGSTPQGMNAHEIGRAFVGRQLDHVLLEEFIGGGGMGAVFRALDTNLQRTVAVKVLASHRADSADTQRRFQTEARSAARLDHPNIARVHYVGEDAGVRYIVFEYIAGTNVRDLVFAHGPFRVAEALTCTLQIADAMLHAWQRDVVHRDIKPSNIIIANDGTAKLVDMGLARLQQMDQEEDDLTTSGMTLGTFDYISPEQARNPRDADVRSDIYSLGCTLFFMLSGRPPFPEGTAVEKLLKHQTEQPPSLLEVRPDLPAIVASLIDRMLAKRPEDRFESPGDVITAIAAVAEQLGISNSQTMVPTEWIMQSASMSAWRRHAPWLVPTALLLLTVGLLGYAWNRGAPPEPFPELQLPSIATESADQSTTPAPPPLLVPNADAARHAADDHPPDSLQPTPNSPGT